MPLLSPIRATWPANLILLDFITRTIMGEEYRSLSSSLCSLLYSPVISSLLDSTILLSTLFSNILSLRSSLIVTDQVSHPNDTTRDRGFQSRRGQGCFSVVIVVCCQVEVSATSWSLVQKGPTDCGASLSVFWKPQEWGSHGPRWAAAP